MSVCPYFPYAVYYILRVNSCNWAQIPQINIKKGIKWV